MESYRLIIELLCPGCSKDKCSEHISRKLVIDPKTGLEGEAVCVCKNHRTEN